MTSDNAVDARQRPPLAERIDPEARSRLAVRERAGLQVVEARLPGPFRAIFTTRLDGISGGPYASLNLDQRSGDVPDNVRRNRARVAAALADEVVETDAGVTSGGGRAPRVAVARDVALARTSGGTLVAPGTDGSWAGGPEVGESGNAGTAPRPRRLVSPLQVHGLRVAGAADYVAAQRTEPGAGAETVPDLFTDPADGLTLHPVLDRGLAALLLFADCVPLVLVGDVDMAVVHGGWRGLLSGVIEQAGCAMTGPPALAIVGPSLGPCCFTVGEEVAEAFAYRFGSGVVNENRVDLWASASAALRELGLAPSRIVNPRLCTACNRDLFYSYRAEGPVTGRHGCAAWTAEP